MVTSLNEILVLASKKNKQKLVVVAADDENVLLSLKAAIEKNLVLPILVGNKKKIELISKEISFDISKIELFDCNDHVEASQKAVDLVQSNYANFIMKGLIPTAILLGTIVKKENGLLLGKLLSHFAISQIPSYHKLLAFTDGAMNIYPDLNDKEYIIRNAILVMGQLGYNKPKVAIISPVEIVNPKIESTVHASKLKEMNKHGLIGDCIIDGPFALDNAVSLESAKHKAIESEVAGDADLLIVPNLDAGNILYKSINFLAGGTTAAIITGAKVPIVLTSRSDSELSKLYSIALAIACV